MTNDRYEEFLDKLLEGDLSEGELRQFNEMLQQHADLARDARERLAEHRLLGLLYQPFDVDQFGNSVMDAAAKADAQSAESVFNASVAPSDSRVDVTPDKTWLLGLCLLAASILIAIGFYARRGAPRDTGDDVAAAPRPVVATVLLAQRCNWTSAKRAEGERLTTGPLQLRSGLAVIRFDGGAELVLSGDCSLNLLSAGGVQVDWWNIIVRASDEAIGFRVQTPSSELIDLGTEFSVNVGGDGETKLNVLEGEVSIRPLKNVTDQPRLLRKGSSVLVRDAASDPTDTAHDGLRFATVIRRADPRGRADLRYAYDGFFYDEGELPLVDSTAGHGWRGPWRKRTVAEGYRSDQDTTDSLDIVHGELNVTWGVRGGELGMLRMPPGVTVRLREMRRSINLDQDGIVYFSLMVREPDHSQRDPQAQPREGVRLTLRSTDDYRGESLSFGVSNHLKARVGTQQGVGFVSSTLAPTGQSTLWIGKVIARAEGEDEVYFRIFGEDEELDYAEPSQWHVISRNLDLSANLSLVVLTSEGHAPRYIDELRIGPTWRSVAPLRP